MSYINISNGSVRVFSIGGSIPQNFFNTKRTEDNSKKSRVVPSCSKKVTKFLGENSQCKSCNMNDLCNK